MRAQQEADFVAFVHEASPGLLRTAWYLCGNPHTAEELVQGTLERLYVVWPRVRREGAMAYARRTLTHLSTDTWRRTRREVITAHSPERTDSRRTDHPGAHVDLVRALSALPPRERQVVVLRYYADQSESAVAELLGVSIGTVKSSASRGLVSLRRQLSEGESHVTA